MSEKFDSVKYKNNFAREKYDRVLITMPKGKKEVLKETASKNNISVNELINRAIEAYITR